MKIDDGRITDGMTQLQAIMALSGSNFAVEKVCFAILLQKQTLTARRPPVVLLLLLDRLRIYETDIYTMWNDVCERNTMHMIFFLLATESDTTGKLLPRLKDAIVARVGVSVEEVTGILSPLQDTHA